MLVMRLQKGARSYFVLRMPEWVLSLTLGGFAAQMLSGRDVFSSMPAFEMLGQLVSQTFWGFYAGTVALIWFVALTINGVVPVTRRWTPWARGIAALFASSFWAVNTWFFLLEGMDYPGLVPNAGFAMIALSESLIIAREIGVQDGKASNGRPHAY